MRKLCDNYAEIMQKLCGNYVRIMYIMQKVCDEDIMQKLCGISLQLKSEKVHGPVPESSEDENEMVSTGASHFF